MPQLQLRNVTVHLTHPPLLHQANLVVQPGEKIALVGRNGTGKSTLLKLLAGLIKPDEGELETSALLKIAYLTQDVPQSITGTIAQVVATGLGERAALLEQYLQLSSRLTDEHDEALFSEISHVQHKMDELHAWGVSQQVATVLTRLGLPAEQEFSLLSSGMKRRVLLARALVNDPDILLLDEPTNHLDIQAIAWLEQLLSSLPITIIFVSHDRTFTKAIAQRIIELDRGVLSDWPGTFNNYLLRKAEALHAEELERERFAKKLAQEETWIRQGIKARRTRNEGRVRALKALRVQAAQQQKQMGVISATIQEGAQSGKQVILAQNISYAYEQKTVVKDFTLGLMRGAKIGIVGANGAGKTTLIKLLLGELKPQSGKVSHGTNLEISYFDQLREQLNDDQTVRENVGGGSDQVTVNGKQQHIMSYLQDFLFTPERANGKISNLSGGERNRLLLAKLFTKTANLLVFDEPTNDLDLESLELLEDMLGNFAGTVLIISHDREFLDNLVTKTLVFTQDGIIKECVGDSSVWLELITKAKAAPASIPDKPRLSGASTKSNIDARQKVALVALSYREQQELRQLPKLIEELEARLASLQQDLANPTLYQGNPQEAQSLANLLKETETQLLQSYRQWEELEQRAKSK